jgi:hypothetical protein
LLLYSAILAITAVLGDDLKGELDNNLGVFLVDGGQAVGYIESFGVGRLGFLTGFGAGRRGLLPALG